MEKPQNEKKNVSTERVKRHRAGLSAEKKIEIRNLERERIKCYRAKLKEKKRLQSNISKEIERATCNEESKIFFENAIPSTSFQTTSHSENVQISYQDSSFEEKRRFTEKEVEQLQEVDKNTVSTERVKRHRAGLSVEKQIENRKRAREGMKCYRAKLKEKKALQSNVSKEIKKVTCNAESQIFFENAIPSTSFQTTSHSENVQINYQDSTFEEKRRFTEKEVEQLQEVDKNIVITEEIKCHRANLSVEKEMEFRKKGIQEKNGLQSNISKEVKEEICNADSQTFVMTSIPSTSYQTLSHSENVEITSRHLIENDVSSSILHSKKVHIDEFNDLKNDKIERLILLETNNLNDEGEKCCRLVNDVNTHNDVYISECLSSDVLQTQSRSMENELQGSGVGKRSKRKIIDLESTVVPEKRCLYKLHPIDEIKRTKTSQKNRKEINIFVEKKMENCGASLKKGKRFEEKQKFIKKEVGQSQKVDKNIVNTERVKRHRKGLSAEKQIEIRKREKERMKCYRAKLKEKKALQSNVSKEVRKVTSNADCETFVVNSIPSTSFHTLSNSENGQISYQNSIEDDDSPSILDFNVTQEKLVSASGNCSEELELNKLHSRTYAENYLGKMLLYCTHCDAKHFKDEKVSTKITNSDAKNLKHKKDDNKKYSFADCCSHGGIKLKSLNYPSELKMLLDGSHEKSSHFRQNIRCYNNSFAFASFNANVINFHGTRRGPYCFKIQGQIYYQMNKALYPENGDDPSYGQLFIYDPDDAIEYRLNKNDRLDRDIVRGIENFMRKHNTFSQSFRMMKEVIEIETALATKNDEEIPELKLLFTLKKGKDPRRFNFQRVNEVAAIFNTNSEGEIPDSYVTVYNKISKELQLVSSLDPCVEPFIYPLFYPFGEKGYCIDMLRNDTDKRLKKHRISRASYVKYKMAIRDDIFNQFLYGGRLFQQWLVDNYVKMEKDRLQYCANHQTQLRSESYRGLIDHINDVAQRNDTPLGKLVVLPSTFIGSPRNMMELYQDSMAIVAKHGKPDLFITMTCNPQWKEITENLLPNQTVADRPDIVARVFSLKVKHLIECIVKNKCFGDVKSYVYVIEFQKRGLPHIHLLVILTSNSKILTPESVDGHISAEIPDELVNPRLHEIIMANNIHGPCGDWCFVDGKCSKNFPKPLQEDTTVEENCYVVYRRRNTGKTYTRPNEYVVDNRFVVPYSPKLSQTFNCHINVEVVSSIKSVKYLYKYIYKGHDAASIIITNSNGEATINHNEINHYEENRYVGPVEAAWRILSKTLSKKSHSINRLPIHLQNEQNILIRQVDTEEEISFNLNKNTKLLDYFLLNERDVNARQYFYTEIPEYYSWDKTKCKWNKRLRKEKAIGRIYSVNPCHTELFHLRLLLLTTKGAISYESLKTVNGVLHETFTSACLALGLIEDDHEWKATLQESTLWMMPQSLRRLFVRILIHCRPINAGELWEQFKIYMSEDYARNVDNIAAEKMAYIHVKNMLSDEGYKLNDFLGLMDVEDETDNFVVTHSINIEEEKELGKERYDKLNVKQKDIVDFILNAVNDNNDNTCRCVYVDGPGGSGKTFMYITLWHLLRSLGKTVCNMAFTGIAATLLPMGRTVHKILGLPVPLYNDSSSNIKVQSKEGLYLKNVDVFIWDEAPMSPKYALEIMDRTLRDIMQVDVPFGGKTIILGGDFRQVLPIKQNGTRSEIINLSIKNSKLWQIFAKFTLSENMRALPEETQFVNFLLDVGNGTFNDVKDCVQLPDKILEEGNIDISTDVYGELIKQKRFEDLALCAILAPRNIDVDEINNNVVQLLDKREEKVYRSIDSVDNRDNNNDHEVILPDYLNTLSPPGLPPHVLHLRINSVVMLIRNLSINEGLCNGTRLMVLALSNHVIKCKILTGDKRGNIVFIHRILLYCENVYPFTFKRTQFPIKLAFAMTINKSQGQTFDKIAIDLRKDVFNHGQLYVALSRVRSFNSIKVYLGNQRSRKCIKNYVYKEIFE